MFYPTPQRPEGVLSLSVTVHLSVRPSVWPTLSTQWLGKYATNISIYFVWIYFGKYLRQVRLWVLQPIKYAHNDQKSTLIFWPPDLVLGTLLGNVHSRVIYLLFGAIYWRQMGFSAFNVALVEMIYKTKSPQYQFYWFFIAFYWYCTGRLTRETRTQGVWSQFCKREICEVYPANNMHTVYTFICFSGLALFDLPTVNSLI